MKNIKKTFVLIICLLLTVTCFASCTEHLFTTQEFRLYRYFSENYKVGMDKQGVIKRIEYPDSYRDVDGNYYRWNYTEDSKEDFNKGALDDTVAEWYYTCYELKDPANPYSLSVYFDSDGRCINVEFEVVPGG